MARRTLTEEQRLTLLTWLAADVPPLVMREWARLAGGWPPITDRQIYYYRHLYAADLLALRAARRASALTTGLALKEERVAQLTAHADALALIKWVADRKTGKLHNEKAWRETLDDIARELGQRVQQVDVQSGGQALPALREIVVTLTHAGPVDPDRRAADPGPSSGADASVAEPQADRGDVRRDPGRQDEL